MKKLDYWDGLRTIFCLVVVISHIFLAFYPNAPKPLKSMGNLAVIYFLFLSGGVLGLKTYIKTEQERFTIKDLFDYTLHRYLRLLPAVAVSVLLSTLIYVLGGGVF